jgi:hypothetical protein
MTFPRRAECCGSPWSEFAGGSRSFPHSEGSNAVCGGPWPNCGSAGNQTAGRTPIVEVAVPSPQPSAGFLVHNAAALFRPSSGRADSNRLLGHEWCMPRRPHVRGYSGLIRAGVPRCSSAISSAVCLTELRSSSGATTSASGPKASISATTELAELTGSHASIHPARSAAGRRPDRRTWRPGSRPFKAASCLPRGERRTRARSPAPLGSAGRLE